MAVVVILICIAMAISGSFLVLFIISARSGQYNGMESPKIEMLQDHFTNDSSNL